jgi:Cu2+-exporting ATPase
VSSRSGDEVFAGTLNIASTLKVRVTQAGETSRLAKLVRQVEEGARRRAPVVLLADQLSGWFTAAVLALAALVYVVWMQLDPAHAVDNAIALLVVTCPCALALATPLAVTAAVGRAARRGILIKGGDALERLAKPATLILDKTGTITEGTISLDRFDGRTG